LGCFLRQCLSAEGDVDDGSLDIKSVNNNGAAMNRKLAYPPLSAVSVRVYVIVCVLQSLDLVEWT